MARALYHAASPTFCRSLDGLRQDITSLPARLRDPVRRLEPWQTVHHVGGEYGAAGREIVQILRDHGQLRADDRVLDIGCGNGRVAWPLGEALGPGGVYVGFDVSAAAVDYCRRRIARARPNFDFHHLDIRNGIYNPRGPVDEREARFPCGDATMTIAFATSVLTHLPWPAIERYLAETRRVLAPGGRALLTAFVLTPEVRRWAAQERTAVRLQPYGDCAMTTDPHWPENAMAYDERAFRKAAAQAGLRLQAILAGQWRPEPSYAGGQDLLVMTKD